MKKIIVQVFAIAAVFLLFSCQKPRPQVTVIMKYSPHCEVCVMMKPIVAEMQKYYGNKIEIKKFNLDDYNEYQASSAYKSTITPAFFFLDKEGNVYEHFEGPAETAKMKSAIERGLN